MRVDPGIEVGIYPMHQDLLLGLRSLEQREGSHMFYFANYTGPRASLGTQVPSNSLQPGQCLDGFMTTRSTAGSCSIRLTTHLTPPNELSAVNYQPSIVSLPPTATDLN